jgi:predicted ribosomally synthesized peptide with nif11-like leader
MENAMSIQGAIDFLNEPELDPNFRKRMYACKTAEALLDCLKEQGYPFTGAEFEEAVDLLHVKCKESEDADVLMNRANWFRMVVANV